MRLRRKRGNRTPTDVFLTLLALEMLPDGRIKDVTGHHYAPSIYVPANEWKIGNCASVKSGKLLTLTQLTSAIKAVLRPGTTSEFSTTSPHSQCSYSYQPKGHVQSFIYL